MLLVVFDYLWNGVFGSDCRCRDGRGTGQSSQQPLIKGKCVARERIQILATWV